MNDDDSRTLLRFMRLALERASEIPERPDGSAWGQLAELLLWHLNSIDGVCEVIQLIREAGPRDGLPEIAPPGTPPEDRGIALPAVEFALMVGQMKAHLDTSCHHALTAAEALAQLDQVAPLRPGILDSIRDQPGLLARWAAARQEHATEQVHERQRQAAAELLNRSLADDSNEEVEE